MRLVINGFIISILSVLLINQYNADALPGVSDKNFRNAMLKEVFPKERFDNSFIEEDYIKENDLVYNEDFYEYINDLIEDDMIKHQDTIFDPRSVVQALPIAVAESFFKPESTVEEQMYLPQTAEKINRAIDNIQLCLLFGFIPKSWDLLLNFDGYVVYDMDNLIDIYELSDNEIKHSLLNALLLFKGLLSKRATMEGNTIFSKAYLNLDILSKEHYDNVVYENTEIQDEIIRNTLKQLLNVRYRSFSMIDILKSERMPFWIKHLNKSEFWRYIFEFSMYSEGLNYKSIIYQDRYIGGIRFDSDSSFFSKKLFKLDNPRIILHSPTNSLYIKDQSLDIETGRMITTYGDETDRKIEILNRQEMDKIEPNWKNILQQFDDILNLKLDIHCDFVQGFFVGDGNCIHLLIDPNCAHTFGDDTSPTDKFKIAIPYIYHLGYLLGEATSSAVSLPDYKWNVKNFNNLAYKEKVQQMHDELIEISKYDDTEYSHSLNKFLRNPVTTESINTLLMRMKILASKYEMASKNVYIWKVRFPSDSVANAVKRQLSEFKSHHVFTHFSKTALSMVFDRSIDDETLLRLESILSNMVYIKLNPKSKLPNGILFPNKTYDLSLQSDAEDVEKIKQILFEKLKHYTINEEDLIYTCPYLMEDVVLSKRFFDISMLSAKLISDVNTICKRTILSIYG